MQENGTEQLKVYRRTRTMLKMRSTPTEAMQTGYRNSQLTEPEKAEFHTPAIPNTVRDCVQENSLENVSPDLVQMTVPTLDTYPQTSAASFDSKSEEREEIADTPAPALEMADEPGTYTPGSRKSTRKNFGKPSSSFSDFYMYHKRHYHICKDTTASGTVDYQSEMLNFEFYVVYVDKLAIFSNNHNRH